MNVSRSKKLNLHVLYEKEEDMYSALCLELDVASQGTSLSKARKNLHEAVELYLEDVIIAGDEKDFIPRPAPLEEWLKYFEIEAQNLKESILRDSKHAFRVHEVMYAS